MVIALLLYPFPGAGLLAFVVFAAAALTDVVDGRVARARGEVSPLGVFLDLTADKVLVAGVLIAMVEVSLLSTWIAALLLIRELVVQGVRQLAASADVVMPARGWGKGKTFTTLLGMGLLADGLARIDAEGAPAFLESSNPVNTPRYELLGFAVCGEFELSEDGPNVTQMWRDPA